MRLDFDEGLDLTELSKNHAVVLVPNHQSHADYIAISYILYSKFKLVISVASGINLNVFPIGHIFRNLGGFFIRRSFGSDILYRLTLEGYLYYLLKTGKIVEFFFEGGRSRTGKLLSPRFGFFAMLLEVSKYLGDKKLAFVPVSVVHEIVPETKSHVKELLGSKKKKESFLQILKLIKIFKLKMGSVHIHLSNPIWATSDFEDTRKEAHNLAFKCFRKVGEEMMVTPSSLIAMVLLDATTSMQTWEDIWETSEKVIDYCRSYHVPLSSKLENENRIKSLKNALNIFINNKDVEIKKAEFLNEVYYSIKSNKRSSLLYFKNTIVHHFIVPNIISGAWVKVLSGHIDKKDDLTSYLLRKRKQLSYEFYLPSAKELIDLGLKILAKESDREVKDLDSAISLPAKSLSRVMYRIGVFSKSLNYLIEAHYLALLSFSHFKNKKFNKDEFFKVSNELFKIELSHGKLIQLSETYSRPSMENALKYFQHTKVLEFSPPQYKVKDEEYLLKELEDYAVQLTDLLTINYKIYAQH